MSKPVVVVVGAGPGVGASVARRFGEEGYDVALLARTAPALKELAGRLEAEGITAGWTRVDVADADALTEAVTAAGRREGRIDVLHFNLSTFRQADPLRLSADELLEDVRRGVAALLTAVQAARPFMSAGGRVTATGSMAADRPSAAAASLGVQKAALRNLVRSLDTALRPDGIRAVSVTVNGTLAVGTAFDPDRVADAIYAAATRSEDGWTDEVAFDG